MANMFKKILSAGLSLAIVLSLITLPVKAAALVPGWDTIIHGTPDVTIDIDNKVKYKGNSSVRIVNRTPTTGGVYVEVCTYVQMEAGKKYNICGMVKSEASSHVQFVVKEGGWSRESLTPFGKTYDWTRFEYTYVPQTTNKFGFSVLIDGTTNGVWVDELQITDIETGKKLITNPGFEANPSGESSVEGDVANQSLEKIYNKISSSENFSFEDMVKVRGGFKYMPVYTAKEIKIDGDMSDWENYPVLAMPTLSTQYQVYMNDGKPKDVQAECKFAQDEENLYFIIKVKDDVFKYFVGTNEYWKGDSIQMAISTLDEDYGSEIGFIHNAETGKGEIYTISFTEEQLSKMDIATSQKEDSTIYEVKIPWNIKFPSGRPEQFLFDFLINDNDGTGRRYAAELAPGIAEGKINQLFPTLEILDGEKDWYAWVQGERNVYTETEYSYEYYIVNEGDTKTFNFTNSITGESETITVPANSGIRRAFKKIFDTDGEEEISGKISSGNEEVEVLTSVKITRTPPTPTYAQAVADKLRVHAKEIKILIDKCTAKGIPADYQMPDYLILSDFADYVEEDIKNNDLARTYYTEEVTDQLYEKTKKELNDLLSGAVEPIIVPHYITSKGEIDGFSEIATVEYDGEEIERPVFYVGFGHTNKVLEDIPELNKWGFNTIQTETGPRVLLRLKEGAEVKVENYEFNPDRDLNQIRIKALGDAVEGNVAYGYMISPHYFINEINQTYNTGITTAGFLNYNINQPVAREIIEKHIRTLLPIITEYDSLHNICLTNEPQYQIKDCGDFFMGDWHAYLKEVYGNDINKLNEAYRTNHTSFEEIDMDFTDNPAKRYDYKRLNDKIFAEWHKWMADIVREYAPDIPIHSKIMCYLRSDYGIAHTLNNGTGFQEYQSFSDYHGCDCWNYFTGEAGKPLCKNLWYDFMSSFGKKPVVNTEDHVTPDRVENYDLRISDYVSQDIWQGAIHGRLLTNIWVWDRTADKANDTRSNMLYRPDAIAKVSDVALDLNRFAYEVTALQNQEPEIGILYSDENGLNNNASMSSMYEAYAASVHNGKRVKFIHEYNINSIHNIKLLIIPSVKYIKGEVLDEIKKYIQNGGKILALGEDLLALDEHCLPNDTETVNYIIGNSKVLPLVATPNAQISPSPEEYTNIIGDILKEMGLDFITVIDADTGKRAVDVEWNTAVYDGKVIINLSNTSTAKSLKVYAGDKLITGAKELRTGEILGDVIELGEYKVALLETTLENPFIDTFGHWGEDEIFSLYKKGIVNGKSESVYDPNGTVTRWEFHALLSRAAGMNLPEYDSESKDFRPNDKITREEMCEMLVKFYEAANGKINKTEGISFTDVINNMEFVSKAVSAGLMQGRPNGTFDSDGNATRAEAATVIKRFLN